MELKEYMRYCARVEKGDRTALDRVIRFLGKRKARELFSTRVKEITESCAPHVR